MTIRNLDLAFAPKSVALIGASPQPGSVGQTITENLRTGGFAGPVWLVNPSHKEIAGQACYPNVGALPEAPDLAVIATPPATVAGLIGELGHKGTRAAIVITAGLSKEQRQAMLSAAQPYCLRIIGNNCLGMCLPNIGLNASFAHLSPAPGKLAMISQSGALMSAILGWAKTHHVGFSAVVSMGDMADVDAGDLLEFLAADISTRAILLYLESVPATRKFMSAARAAARAKPVIAIKSGRFPASAQAAATHTGALAGADNVIDAAFARAGIVRVYELESLFVAAEALTRLKPISGNRLGILTNGGGAGVLAVDQFMALGGELAPLGEASKKALDAVLPATWSHANPVDIIGDADAARYGNAMAVLLDSDDSDALLVLNCPTALTSSTEAAQAVVKAVEHHREQGPTKPVLCTWLGGDETREARSLFAEAGIPSYDSPADGVRAFHYLRTYTRRQEELMRVPKSRSSSVTIDSDAIREVLEKAAASGRDMLNAAESAMVLDACGIPVVMAQRVQDAAGAQEAAAGLLREHAAVAIKIASKDISHKSDVGGVALDIATPEEAREAAETMEARVRKAMPSARLEGFSVEPMIVRPQAHELIVGIGDDALFGPVILFGAGGTGTEVIADTAVALPPLDPKFAQDLIGRTEIQKLLKGYRNRPAADIAAIADTLMRISQLIIDHPGIRELDINPLLADENGIFALDARIRFEPSQASLKGPNTRLAIRPYPSQWEKRVSTPAGSEILIRPIRPEDEHLYETFIANLAPADIRFRFLAPRKEFSHAFIARLTQIDYNRTMAFVALDPADSTLLGVARLHADPDYERAEYAVIVRSDRKGQGLGWALMHHLIDYANAEGLKELNGDVLTENTGMLRMCHELGFSIEQDPDDPVVCRVALKLPVERLASGSLPG